MLVRSCARARTQRASAVCALLRAGIVFVRLRCFCLGACVRVCSCAVGVRVWTTRCDDNAQVAVSDGRDRGKGQPNGVPHVLHHAEVARGAKHLVWPLVAGRGGAVRGRDQALVRAVSVLDDGADWKKSHARTHATNNINNDQRKRACALTPRN